MGFEIDPNWIMLVVFAMLGAIALNALERKQWIAFVLTVCVGILLIANAVMT